MDRSTINTYNQLAREYDNETADFWDRFPRTFLDFFAQSVKGKVLDAGSGPGRDAILLRERGLELTCLDASQSMVDICNSKGLNCVLGDFNALPFEDGSFDGAWAYTSFLHVPKSEVQAAFSEIRRVLKDGGIFGLGLIEGESEGYRESAGVNQPRWFSFYTKPEVEELLQRNGFEIIYFEEFKPNSKNYLNFISKKLPG